MSDQAAAPTKPKGKKKSKAAEKAEKVAAKVEKTVPPPETPAEPPPAAVRPEPLEQLTSDQRDMIEKLSSNLARAALTAQGAIAEAALRQAERQPGCRPTVARDDDLARFAALDRIDQLRQRGLGFQHVDRRHHRHPG